MPVTPPPSAGTLPFWQVCQQGTTCTPWNPVGGDFGVHGARSDYGIPLPVGTPIEAPVNGVVLPQHPGGGWYSVFGRQSFGGEVDILTTMPEYGGLANVGVIHLDTASVSPGQTVRKGDIIGTSGGQTSGGNWPSSPQFSSGPHVGVQVHRLPAWGQLLNPGVLMQNLWAGKDSSRIPDAATLAQYGLSASSDSSSSSGGGAPSFWCYILPWVPGCPNPIENPGAYVPGAQGGLGFDPGAAAQWLLNPMRMFKVLLGIGLTLTALLLAFLPDIAAGLAAAQGIPEASAALQGTGRGNVANRLRRGIVAAGAIQERRTLRATARRAEERAQRQERREQARQQQASIRAARANIGAPGRPPTVDLSPGARARARARTAAAQQRGTRYAPTGADFARPITPGEVGRIPGTVNPDTAPIQHGRVPGPGEPGYHRMTAEEMMRQAREEE